MHNEDTMHVNQDSHCQNKNEGTAQIEQARSLLWLRLLLQKKQHFFVQRPFNPSDTNHKIHLYSAIVMTNQTTPPNTPHPIKSTTTTSTEARPSGEFHCHGDPVLQAILQHDTATDEAERRKELKALYDQHARMVEHERAGAYLGDHTLWCLQDYLPEQHQPQHGKKN